MADRLRVLFAMGSLAGGGAERQLIGILNHLDRTRFTPLLYLVDRRGELLEEVPDDVPVFSFWERYRRPRWNYPGLLHRMKAHDLAAVMCEESIQVIYDRTMSMTLIAAAATRRIGVPRISVVTNDPQHDFDDSVKRFRLAKRCLLTRAYRQATRVVAVSEGIRKSTIDRFRLAPAQVTTAYNLLDLDRIARLATERATDLDHDRFHIVTVGSLARQKGLRYLLLALDEVVSRGRMPKLLLSILGQGPLEDELKALVQLKRLDENVRFEGYVANPFSIIKQSQLYCLSSIYEGMPNALLEAMACGVPVLATDCPSGPSEVLDRGRFGHLVPPAEPEALAAAIEDAVNNYEAWRALAPYAQQHVADTFSVEAGMAKLESLLVGVHSEATNRTGSQSQAAAG